jgi:hypothetical protein
MYNDKNYLTAQTKSFMNRYGMKNLTTASPFVKSYENLVKIGATVRNYINYFIDEINPEYDSHEEELLYLKLNNSDYKVYERKIVSLGQDIADYISTLLKLVPTDPNRISAIEQTVLNTSQTFERKIYPRATILSPSEELVAGKEPTKEQRKSRIEKFTPYSEDEFGEVFEDESNILIQYLDFLNGGLPNDSLLMSLTVQLIDAWKNFDKADDTLGIEAERYYPNYKLTDLPAYVSFISCIETFISILENILSTLSPNDYWTIPRLELLKREIDRIEKEKGRRFEAPEQVVPPMPVSIVKVNPPLPQDEEESVLFSNSSSSRSPISNEDIIDFRTEEEKSGKGIHKRRGRPRGCGIVKHTTKYKDSVKAHAVLDKGIMETPRFLKFGKYLVNNHKLHNEDIFALKRPSGGNIVEIPSIKVSKNLSGVIKKMLGGAIPTYSDISKLSEPEKAYLHKISQKSNILDKFDIPAPSKDNIEKDIHQFEVMRGEIMAGNDNKELLKKFKLHILKLSKNGTLPKREVQEILEDLIELGN